LQLHLAVMTRRSTKLRRNTFIDVTQIGRLIYLIRGQRVMLDSDLANIYGVTTSRFNEQIKRNSGRFPSDFRFQLTSVEHSSLRSQFAILEKGRGRYRKYPPYAFTEHGAIMAASVLSSPQAVEMSILVVRAFVRLRELLSTHHQLAAQMSELEKKLSIHDEQIVVLFEAIKQLMEEPVPEKRRIGFEVEDG
jgi:phage regulator Rha-like protein